MKRQGLKNKDMKPMNQTPSIRVYWVLANEHIRNSHRAWRSTGREYQIL